MGENEEIVLLDFLFQLYVWRTLI